MNTTANIAASVACILMGAAAQAGATFDAVKNKGFVQCGLSEGISGFSRLDSTGIWRGIDAELCRAVAAAMFGDASKHKVTALTAPQRFTALQSGEIDVLIRGTTQTLTRDATLGLTGAGVNFYDTQGIMVPKSLGVTSARELNGVAVCMRPVTTTELNLADWFRSNNLDFTPVVVENADETVRAFAAGRCDAYTTEKSQLALTRTTLLENPDDYVILPEEFSKEPLGPMVR